MGRQAHLARLTLGRSAFETRDIEENTSSGDEGFRHLEPLPSESPIAYQANYNQQYDKKGYPQNLVSKLLKKRWRHSVNDLLATVGESMAGGRLGPKVPYSASDRRKVEDVAFENSLGIFTSAADWGLWWLCMYWPSALRQRIQTFAFYSGTPVTRIIRTEWKVKGSSAFLFAGSTASFLFALLDVGADWLRRRAIEFAARLLESNISLTPSGAGMLRVGFEAFSILFDTAVFFLIVPLEIYGTLQRLGLLTAVPILPNPRRCLSVISSLTQQHPMSGWTDRASRFTWGLLNLTPLLYPWLVLNYRQRLNAKIYNYVWLALPRPTRPDQYSLLAAKEDELDVDTISGLVDEHDPQTGEVRTTVLDQFAADLQSIGRKWQIFYDRYVKPVTRLATSEPDGRRRSSVTEVASNAGDPGQDAEYTLPPPLIDPPAIPPAEPITDEAPNHFSPPQTSPESTPPPSPLTPGTPSNSSSTAPSNPSSPRALALYSNHEDGTVHVNITIAVPQREILGAGGNGNDNANHAEADNAPVGGDDSGNVTREEGNAAMTTRSPNQSHPGSRRPSLGSRGRYSRPPPSFFSAPRRPYHRVTALTAHPADSMAQRLSSLITDILFLPLESFFVRSIAFAFLASPASNPDAVAAAAGWRGLIYPTRNWSGLGLSGSGSGGSWRRMLDYAGKMVLVQGLEAVIGVVVWQAGMGVVWEIGRRWCEWGTL